MTISEWTETSASLKFRAGELTLFSVDFRCLSLMVHFRKLSCDPLQPPPPFDRFMSGIDAAIIRSHPVAERLPSLTRLSNAIRYVPKQYLRYYVNLERSFDSYLKQFSAKSRSTLQRKIRKFSEASEGSIKWREYWVVDEMPEFHELARTVSRETYQERLLDAGLPEDPDFLHTMRQLALDSSARGYVLFLHGNPVAYMYCPIVDRAAVLYQYVGYDPRYQHLSPGTVLLYLVLEKLMSEGTFIMFDFTEGEGQHKEFFSTHNVHCADLYYFSPTFRNRLLLSLHVLADTLSDKAGAFLDRLGVKARIKKLLRATA